MSGSHGRAAPGRGAADARTADPQAEDIEALLPRPPGIFRRWLNGHPVAVDVIIAVCYLLGCAMMATGDVFATWTRDGIVPPEYLRFPAVLVTALRIAVVVAALLLRRRYPLIGMVAVAAALFGQQGAQGAPNTVALAVLLYSVPVYRGVAAGWIGYGIALTANVLLVALPGMGDYANLSRASDAAAPLEVVVTLSIGTALWLLVVLMTGITIGNRRRYMVALIDRAHQLARERDQRARLAVAEERSRIAREMHDIVAHSVSVMIALSEGAARAAELAPEAAADAMRRSAETGRTALAEMRRMLGVLSDPEDGGGALAPQPGIAQLPALVEGFRAAGLDAHLRVTAQGGDAAAGSGADGVDQGHDLAVHRIVQEGLTNALRYAGLGAHVEVAVEREADRTIVTVRDFGPTGPIRPLAGLGSGRGIAGLAERVRMFGGTIEAAPVAAGWLLHAVLPVLPVVPGGPAGIGAGVAGEAEEETP